MRNKKNHIFNRALWTAFIFLIIQQSIVASSTIWITRLIAHIQEGRIFFLFLGLYLASLFIPYFPGAFALLETAKAKVKTNVYFVNQFVDIYRGQVVEWANVNQHSKKSSILIGEAPRTISEYIDYIYNLSSTSLNVVFNLLTIAVLIEPLLLVSYGIGVALAFFILRSQKFWKKTFALRAQQSRIKWSSMLLRAWDNVLLNNSYNFELWRKKTLKRSQRFIGSTIKLERYSQTVSIGMAFALLSPSFALILFLAASRASDFTWLAMMVVTLPRLFQVLAYSYESLFLISDLPVENSRLSTVVQLLDARTLLDSKLARKELENRIQWEKITVIKNGEASVSAKQLLDFLPQTGRITLQGENGSGKTSLLLLIKMLKGESAYYLPVKHALVFQNTMEILSTGQLARTSLNELINKLKSSVVLLDEWDANLDRENSIYFSNLIEKFSKKVCVIESRHKMI